MKTKLCTFGLLLAGCLSAPEQPTLPAPIEVALLPERAITPEEPVRVRFSAPVAAPQSWPIEVTDTSGAKVEHHQTPLDEQTVELAPLPVWRSARYFVVIGEGISGVNGQAISSAPLSFEVEQAPPEPRASVVWPLPTARAPSNLRYMVISTLGVDERRFGLSSSSGQVSTQLLESSSSGLRLLELRAPLQPGSQYNLQAEPQVLIPDGPSGQVHTSTLADASPPEVLATKVRFEGDRAIVEVCASEPVLVRGRAQGPGEALPLIASLRPALRLEGVISDLSPQTDYEITLEVFDPAGNAAEPISIPIHTAAAVTARISEVVPQPLHDWGDSAGGGQPFDARPGVGAVSAADEWVELVNMGTAPIDLTRAGLRLRLVDTSPMEQPLQTAPGMYFGSGGSIERWWPGEALVVRPRGDMSSRNLTVELLWGAQVLDRVRFGSGTDVVHPGGPPPDLAHEARARDVLGHWAWCSPTPGDPRPTRDCL